MKIWHRIIAVKVSLIVAILSVLLVKSFDTSHEKSTELQLLKQQADYYKQEAERSKKLEERVMGMECKDLRVIKVSVTSYNPVRSQGWKTGLIAANGELATPGIIAISRDLEKKYGIHFGDKVVLENLGVFTVKDYMNPRIHNRVDLLSLVPKFSSKFGCRSGVNLYFNAENKTKNVR